MLTGHQLYLEDQAQPTPTHVLERADEDQLDRIRRRILRDLSALERDLRVVEHPQEQRRRGVPDLEEGSYVSEVKRCYRGLSINPR